MGESSGTGNEEAVWAAQVDHEPPDGADHQLEGVDDQHWGPYLKACSNQDGYMC